MRFLTVLLGVFTLGPLVPAQSQSPQQQREQSVRRGIDYLLQRGQAADGTFSSQTGTAITGLVVAAILENEPGAVSDPRIQKALRHLEANIQSNGGVYAPDSRHQNYETCVSIMAFKAANQNGKYDAALRGAENYIRGQQWDQGEGLESDDPRYGGAGYGSKNRPDLSNTSFFIEALHELGRDGEDEALKKALVFVSRTQNLESPYNTTPFANKVNDGGFYYTPAAGGQSFAGQDAEGGLRSYGSMTYAGLKSMIYAGVSADDPRVKAALQFIKSNYSLQENPGMGAAGLFYYYHTFAKAMNAVGQPTLVDKDGKSHNWAEEMIAELASRQKEDGSWINGSSDRWMEADANLVTAYALLALKHCQPAK